MGSGLKREEFNLVRIASTVALGGLLVGFDATVISGAVPFIRDYFKLRGSDGDLKLGWAVSCLGWGAMAGSLAAGKLSDRYGRRGLLLLTAALFLASSVTAALSTRFPVFVFCAYVRGASRWRRDPHRAAVYRGDCAGPPPRKPGLAESIDDCHWYIRFIFSNYFLLSWGNDNWRWMLGIQVVPAALYFALLMLVPESPRWLLGKGREASAKAAWATVQRSASSGRGFEDVRASLKTQARRFSTRELLTGRLKTVMIFGLGIAFFQQATGINAIFYYLPTIFAQSGGGLSTSFAQSVLVGVVNVGMTLIAIGLIDRLGRRPLLIIGLFGAAASLLTISWAFHATHPPPIGGLLWSQHLLLLALIAYVASFAISLGPVMWVMLSEIFPNDERAAAISVVGFWNSLVSAGVTLIFPSELAILGPSRTFLCFGVIAAAGLVFVLLLAPETKGKTLEELERLLTRPSRELR